MTWLAVMHYAQVAWAWTKTNAHFILLCFVGYYAGAKLLKRKDSEITTLKDALAAQQHKTEIERLKGEAARLEEIDASSVGRDRVLVEQVEKVELQAAEHKRRLLALHNKQLDIHTMTDAQIEESFRNAGL